MAKKIITNAFSFNMVNLSAGTIKFAEIDPDEVKEFLGEEFINTLGHSCELINALTGMDLKPNRVNNTFEPGDVMVLAQYKGPRLPEGATELPEGADMKFYRIYMLDM